MKAVTGGNVIDRFWPGSEPLMSIGGVWRNARSGNTATVLDPSTGDLLTSVPAADEVDVDDAVRSAAAAQEAWARTPIKQRVRALRMLADVVEGYRDSIVELESRDSGNPLHSVHLDVNLARSYLEHWPDMASVLEGRRVQVDAERYYYTSHVPQGVVARLVAFNHPFLFTLAGSIMPLLAGNAVVVKAPPQDPLGALAVARIFEESLPAGVFNVITGDARAGAALVRHPGVRRVSLVGGLPTALAIHRTIGEGSTLKHFTSELGGKSSLIGFGDIDPVRLAEAAVRGMSLEISQGQSCQATSRILVHRDIYEPFVSALAERLDRIELGVAYHRNTSMGPLVSAQHMRRVEGFVTSALDAGSTVAYAGSVPTSTPEGGFFHPPYVFSQVPVDSELFQEEVFGPVMSVTPWSDPEDALRLANAGRYGLAASIWSHDETAAHQMAARVNAGYIWVNDVGEHYLGSPFGGLKDSGVGREQSQEELLSYVDVKSINCRQHSDAYGEHDASQS